MIEDFIPLADEKEKELSAIIADNLLDILLIDVRSFNFQWGIGANVNREFARSNVEFF